MYLHEFQAKRFFRDAGIPVPKGEVVDSPVAIAEVARRLGGDRWMVKAQVHAGERAAAGGVRICEGLEQLESFARSMIGERLITAQNAPLGQPVNQLLIESLYSAQREYYLSALIDPHCDRIVFLGASLDDGDFATTAPLQEKLHRFEVDPLTGLQMFQCRQMAVKLGMERRIWSKLFELMNKLYQMMVEKDLTQVEINPLAENGEGELMALDAKMSVDENALSRQPLMVGMSDVSQDDFHESRTLSKGLGFVSLEGDISCIVNGSGLALATIDMLQLHGGSIGNIIDVGNGVNAHTLAGAFKFLWYGGYGKAILVNIIGGIVHCDVVAAGVIQGMRQYDVHKPVIVRMEGSRAAEARQLFMESGLRVEIVNDVEQLMQRAVEVSRD